MTQTFPLDIARNIERRWQSRSRAAIATVLKNPDAAETGYVPIAIDLPQSPRFAGKLARKQAVREGLIAPPLPNDLTPEVTRAGHTQFSSIR